MNPRVQSRYFFLYAFIKLVFGFLALKYLTGIFQLGDTLRYTIAPQAFESGWIFASTKLVDSLSYTFALVGGGFLANAIFCMASLFGVYAVIKSLCLNRSESIIFYTLLMTPSFMIYTSVISKETLLTFCTGVILASLINIYRIPNYRLPRLLIAFCIYLLIIIKPQFLPSFFLLALFVYSKKSSSRLFLLNSVFVIIFIFAALAMLPALNGLAEVIPTHFSLDGNFTRQNIFWNNKNDIVYFAPKGMLLAWWGPLWDEINFWSPLMIVWVETLVITIILVTLIFISNYRSLNKRKFNLSVFTLLFVVLLALLANYPLGIFNPGSALRYRSGSFLYIVGLVFFIYKINHRFKNRNYDGAK